MDTWNRHGLGPPLTVLEPPGAALPVWAGRLVVAEDGAALAEGVAAIMAGAMIADPRLCLGLATGRTMEPVYAALVRRLTGLPPEQWEAIRADWRSFNLDEYVGLSPVDPRSFAATMRRQLGDPLGLDPGRLQLPRGWLPTQTTKPSAMARPLAPPAASICNCWGLARTVMWASTSPRACPRP